MLLAADLCTRDTELEGSRILVHGASLFKAAFRSSHSKTENTVIVAIAGGRRNYMIL